MRSLEQSNPETKEDGGCRGWGSGGGELVSMGTVAVWEGGKVLEVGGGDGFTTM